MRQEMCARVQGHPMVQQLLDGYQQTKKNSGMMGRAIQGVEDRVVDAVNYSVPIYQYYLQPRIDAVHSTINKSMENTKRMVDTTKSTAVATTTIGIGAAVVVSELIISLGLAGTNWIIDSATAARNISGNAVGRIKDMEKLMEDGFKGYAERAQNAAQIPLSKLTDQANTFLDIANKVMDRLLGVESEPDPVDCTIGNRLLRMVSRFSRVLQARAHDSVIDPMANQVHVAMEQLSSYMKLVEYVHERREWVAHQIEGVQASLNDLKDSVEKQAHELMFQPEEILMQSVRRTSHSIVENINTLRERGAQLLGDNVASKLDSVVSYLGELERTFAEVNDLYGLRDEVLAEARAKMTDFLNWTSGLLVRKHFSNP